MKIYVDGEMPKECYDCPCLNWEDYHCEILNKFTDNVPRVCPLHPVAEREAEVRKEVVEVE